MFSVSQNRASGISQKMSPAGCETRVRKSLPGLSRFRVWSGLCHGLPGLVVVHELKQLQKLRSVVAAGLKVAVECVLIAADQGAIAVDQEVIAVGGTKIGADTVCVVRPANTANFFDLQVREIVAMPRVR